MIRPGSFNLHFSNVLNIFACGWWSCVCHLWRNVCFAVLCPFFYWVYQFDTELHELLVYLVESNPLTVASFAAIFSHSESCLFVIFMVSIATFN